MVVLDTTLPTYGSAADKHTQLPHCSPRGYLLPLKDAVRKLQGIASGDSVTVELLLILLEPYPHVANEAARPLTGPEGRVEHGRRDPGGRRLEPPWQPARSAGTTTR